jgi:phospholipid transport system substrate-binding protein
MIRLSRVLAAVLVVILVSATGSVSQAAQAAKPADARHFIEDLANRALSVLDNGDFDANGRKAEFRKLFTDNFDVDGIARFVLGRYWRRATPQEREEYLTLFRDFVVGTYASRLEQYSGETLKVKNVREDRDEAVVETAIERPEGPPVPVDWRVKPVNGSYRVVDVVVESVSMRITHRSEFASVIQNGGGRVQTLIEKLRKKTAAPQS